MLYCDNKATINIAHNLVHHDWTTLVEVDKHLIKETLDLGKVCTPYVSSSKQLANVPTKGLPNTTFHQIIDMLGMQDIFALAYQGVSKILGILS